ncbi:MAG: thiamine phosphate synthase [Acidobacteria bacterium]|nr:thiamine phosphate synthase [Acidobacteriota bacterium]MCW5950189.1 thiamine phosphate synthase [Pyrinomonadaceae bacterium]
MKDRSRPLPSLYPITDRTLSGSSQTEQVRRLIAAGAQMIQIRDKSTAIGEVLDDIRAAAELCRRAGVCMIVNDRVDVALAVGADGVHLGQDDLPPAAARDLLGPDAIIGYSTHDPAQVAEALHLPIDHIGFGPVFDTATKPDHDPVTGIRMLENAVKLAAGMPVVAIGGIRTRDLAAVYSAGAASAAVISALWEPGALDGIFALAETIRSRNC